MMVVDDTESEQQQSPFKQQQLLTERVSMPKTTSALMQQFSIELFQASPFEMAEDKDIVDKVVHNQVDEIISEQHE